MVQQKWHLDFCAGFIVPIKKGQAVSELVKDIKGSTVELNPDIEAYFLPMLETSSQEYPVDILFESDNQEHPIRTLLRKITYGNQVERSDSAKELAARLARATDKRSEEGLLIILLGHCDSQRRIAVWKFPTDESIRASFSGQGLTIELLQDAFSRDSRYFKAAVFESTTDFWRGKVEDRQASSRITKVSDLWLEQFLEAKVEIRDTVATRFVGDALREISHQKETDDNSLEGIYAVALTLKNKDGETITYREVANLLPPQVRESFLGALKDSRIDIPFDLRADILEAAIPLRIISLDNGFSVRGPARLFDIDDSPIKIEQLGENRVSIFVQGKKIRDKFGVR